MLRGSRRPQRPQRPQRPKHEIAPVSHEPAWLTCLNQKIQTLTFCSESLRRIAQYEVKDYFIKEKLFEEIQKKELTQTVDELTHEIEKLKSILQSNHALYQIESEAHKKNGIEFARRKEALSQALHAEEKKHNWPVTEYLYSCLEYIYLAKRYLPAGLIDFSDQKTKKEQVYQSYLEKIKMLEDEINQDNKKYDVIMSSSPEKEMPFFQCPDEKSYDAVKLRAEELTEKLHAKADQLLRGAEMSHRQIHENQRSVMQAISAENLKILCAQNAFERMKFEDVREKVRKFDQLKAVRIASMRFFDLVEVKTAAIKKQYQDVLSIYGVHPKQERDEFLQELKKQNDWLLKKSVEADRVIGDAKTNEWIQQTRPNLLLQLIENAISSLENIQFWNAQISPSWKSLSSLNAEGRSFSVPKGIAQMHTLLQMNVGSVRKLGLLIEAAKERQKWHVNLFGLRKPETTDKFYSNLAAIDLNKLEELTLEELENNWIKMGLSFCAPDSPRELHILNPYSTTVSLD